MEFVNVTYPVPKESKEVFDAVSAIIAHFKAGKSVTEAAILLPAVLTAVDKVQEVDDEVAANYDAVAAYGAYSILGALKAPKA